MDGPFWTRKDYTPSRRECTVLEDPIATLTSKQRAHLRSLAHHLKPLTQVGADGASEAVLESIEESFNTRELLKVKVLDSAPGDVRETAQAIVEGIDQVQLVQTIGKTIVLFRRHPDDPEIRLPS